MDHRGRSGGPGNFMGCRGNCRGGRGNFGHGENFGERGGYGGEGSLEEVMVATMAVVLVIVVEKAMVVVVVDQEDIETKVLYTVVVVEDMIITMKGEILAVTMVVVGTIMILEITVESSNQIMDP